MSAPRGRVLVALAAFAVLGASRCDFGIDTKGLASDGQAPTDGPAEGAPPIDASADVSPPRDASEAAPPADSGPADSGPADGSPADVATD